MKYEKVILGVVSGMSAVSIGAAIYSFALHNKTGKLVDRLDAKVDRTTEKLSKEIADGVHDSMIKEAVEKAVQVEVARKIANEAERARLYARDILKSTIDLAVGSEWSALKNNVKNDILARVGTIDTSELKREAVAAARDKMLDGVNDAVIDAVDDIKDRFEERIGRYGSCSSIFRSGLTPTEEAINAIVYQSHKSNCDDYGKWQYAQKIADLTRGNKEARSFAIRALREINSTVRDNWYSKNIVNKIIELSKEA